MATVPLGVIPQTRRLNDPGNSADLAAMFDRAVVERVAGNIFINVTRPNRIGGGGITASEKRIYRRPCK